VTLVTPVRADHSPQAVLTYPAGWSRTRLAVLDEAARQAGLRGVRFVREPVGAAAYFVAVLGQRLAPRRCLVVYDFGAGTFDVTVVRSADAGVEVVDAAGLTDVGGNDLDAVVIDLLRAATPDAAGWGRLDWPESPADYRARRALWQDARAAKEQLSRHAIAELYVPVVDANLHVTREEFEQAARPYLDRTVTLTLSTLRSAGVSWEAVGGVLLVGGSSRIPLAASLLQRALRIAPTVLEQPELVVARGSLCAVTEPAPGLSATAPSAWVGEAATLAAPAVPAGGPPAPALAPPPPPVTAPVPPPVVATATVSSPAVPAAPAVRDRPNPVSPPGLPDRSSPAPAPAAAAPGSTQPAPGPDPAVPPPTHITDLPRSAPRLLVAGQLAIVGAAALVVGLFPAYAYADSLWHGRSDTAEMRWYALYLLAVASLILGAGAFTLIPRTRRLIGPGLLLGIVAASTWSLVYLASDRLRYKDVPGILGDGWWVEVVAHLVLVLAACLAGLALVRTTEVRLVRRPPRGQPASLVALLGGAGSLALLFHDRNLWNPSWPPKPLVCGAVHLDDRHGGCRAGVRSRGGATPVRGCPPRRLDRGRCRFLRLLLHVGPLPGRRQHRSQSDHHVRAHAARALGRDRPVRPHRAKLPGRARDDTRLTEEAGGHRPRRAIRHGSVRR
jgi:hypothetical protein